MAKLQKVIEKEQKKNSVITVKLDGGLVQWVEIPDGLHVSVVIVDYDIEGSSHRPDKDETGEDCCISVWKDERQKEPAAVPTIAKSRWRKEKK